MEVRMTWFSSLMGSSIGRKMMMAITGLGFCGFLTGHLAGNLTIYGGKDAFNSYAEHLHALGPLITAMEWGLLTFALIHVITGITLFYKNFNARPMRYAVKKSAGGRSIGSQTMPYTGILMLLFISLHLLNFHFVDKTNTTIFNIVSSAFRDPIYVTIYIVAMIIVAVHVSHGFWSAFQTIGVNHPKYMPLIKILSLVFAMIVGFGFGLLPIFIAFTA
jgi:succinate dehydrogenase / fumarate reductase cytochrome b subunit